jgi:biopolymer transport protein ExbD
MSASPTPSGRGRRREVDADLNLTPYIDLLTCMVAFLLIAAVWTQLARLSVAQKGQGEVESPLPELPRLAVAVHGDGFNVIVKDDQKAIPLAPGGGLDFRRLADELKLVKHAHEDQTTMQILAADGVVFETLVKTMDAAMTAGFPDVSLEAASPGP